MTRLTALLCMSVLLAGCDGGRATPSAAADVPASTASIGLMQLTSDLEYVVDNRQGFAVSDAWVGRTGLRCGVITLDGEAPSDLRFLQRKYGRPEKKTITEQLPTWDNAEWAAECSDRTAELMPNKL